MNESNPEITPVAPTAIPDFKDRSTGLLVFGILTTIMGCLAGLLALLAVVGLAAANKTPNVPPTPLSSIFMIMGIYGGLAVVLIWLGIGSIMAKRWARALLLIFSWCWLVTGIIMVAVMSFILPKTFANLPANANGQPAMPPAAITSMVIGMLLFFGFLFVLLPAIWTFFYNSRHVKATCETRDPVTRWTDACPLPVLGLSLWLMFSAAMMLLIPFMAHGVIPLFGVFLGGLTGSLVCTAVALLWVYCAYQLYKLEVRGWWIVLIATLAYAISSVMTFARHDMTEMYQRMGYPQAQIDQIQKMGLMTGNHMEWMMLLFMVPLLGFLVFVKKYFLARV